MRAAATLTRLLLTLIVVLHACAIRAEGTSKPLRVVLDDNYPPYIFRDANGQPQGILKDLWTLWEERTGIPVDFRPMEWDKARATMARGQADVIDTIFETPERRAVYDFSAPYAALDVVIFFHKDIGGITDAASLRGFTVAVKAGDACIDYLNAHGITTLKAYPSYEDEVKAAVGNEVRLLCIDKPPAVYLFNREGAAAEFRHSPPLFVGHFHWAVAKGRSDLQHMIEQGFARITKAEREAIYTRWMGEAVPVGSAPAWVKDIGYFLVALVVAILSLLLWNRALRSRVAARTGELSATLESLRESEHKLLTILDNVDAYIYLKDPAGRYRFANKPVRVLWNTTMEELVGRDDGAFFDAATAANIRSNDLQVLTEGITLRTEETNTVTQSGETRTYQSTKLPLRREDGSIYALCGISIDTTEHKRTEEQIRQLAYHDLLTGLPNRSLLLDRLTQALAAARRSQRCGAVLFADLDQFKQINDVHGHGIGDAVIREVALRLRDCLRESDTVARFGGDEFVILLPELASEQDNSAQFALTVAEKLRTALEAPLAIQDQSYRTTTSIGVTLFPKDADSVEDLIREADIAMYRAKDSGRNAIVFFEHAMQVVIAERYALEHDLREAVQRGGLELHLQSQMNVAGEVVGAEALVRWRHPERGLVAPAAFIPLAEETGLIVAIGAWVLREACALIAALGAAGHSLHLAVNVSPRQFRQADFVAQVQQVLAETGADPVYLTLEITENLLIEHSTEIVPRMLALSRLGIRFSIDDFGTGYSSLAYLKRLPLNELKIDKSFVQDVPHDPNDVALVEAIISLARHLGFEVVAEGVETQAQLDFLTAQGCGRFQGYFFHRPQPARDWLARLEPALG